MTDSIIKKGLAIVLLAAMVISVSSCGRVLSVNKAKREAASIFEAIKKQDTKKLNSLFTEDVRDTHDLDDEWEVFFDSIDGNIVSYGEIKTMGEEEYVDFGQVTYWQLVITITDVKTDTGTVYESLSYSQTRVDKKHPEREGIGLFSLQIPADNDRGFEEVIVGEIIIYYD